MPESNPPPDRPDPVPETGDPASPIQSAMLRWLQRVRKWLVAALTVAAALVTVAPGVRDRLPFLGGPTPSTAPTHRSMPPVAAMPTTSFLNVRPGQAAQLCTRLRGKLSRPWHKPPPVVFLYSVEGRDFWYNEEIELDEQSMLFWSGTVSIGLPKKKDIGMRYVIYIVDVPINERYSLRVGDPLPEIPSGSHVLGKVNVVRSAVDTPCEKVPRLPPRG